MIQPAPEQAVPPTLDGLVVGCVADDNPMFQEQAVRLVKSIRWFGGALAGARIRVCAVERMADPFRRQLEELGAEVRVVPRFHPANGSSNRLRFFDDIEEEIRSLLVLDCDTLVVRDPLPLLAADRLQARVAPLPTVTHRVFERLFRHYGFALPERRLETGWTGTPTIPYFNDGVLFLPADAARVLAPAWGRFNRELADHPERVYPCQEHLDQAALSLALTVTDLSCDEAPFELNYPLNTTHLEPPEGLLTLDPAILHYHERVDPDGIVRQPPYPIARLRAEIFNQRLREERRTEGARIAVPRPAAPPPQVAVLAMHRSGSSAVTRLLDLAGLSAGPEERFAIPDLANPKGYWENSDVVLLDDALLAAHGAAWSEVDGDLDFELARLPVPQARAFEARARELVASFDAAGPWVIKDPRLCLLFPFWRRVLARPAAVLVYRDPLPVARSLEDRDGLPLPVGIALWELYVRRALAGSLGLPRALVSYHELMEDPPATLRRLLAELTRQGIEGLAEPTAADLDNFLEPGLDRHPRDAAAQRALLTPPQLELLAALASGAALALDPVPPLSAGARAILAAHRSCRAAQRAFRREIDRRDVVIGEMESNQALDLREARAGEEKAKALEETARAREKVAKAREEELDSLLAAVFGSRSWRIGHAASRLWRRMSGSADPTAFEKWLRLRE